MNLGKENGVGGGVGTVEGGSSLNCALTVILLCHLTWCMNDCPPSFNCRDTFLSGSTEKVMVVLLFLSVCKIILDSIKDNKLAFKCHMHKFACVAGLSTYFPSSAMSHSP